jgi:hypothetical protein
MRDTREDSEDGARKSPPSAKPSLRSLTPALVVAVTLRRLTRLAAAVVGGGDGGRAEAEATAPAAASYPSTTLLTMAKARFSTAASSAVSVAVNRVASIV